MKNSKKIIKDNLNIIYMFINFLIFNIFIIKFNIIFSKSLIDQIVFGLVLTFIPYFVIDSKKLKLLKDYNNIFCKILIFLISIWISFSLIGSNLFLENINRFLLSKIIYLLVLSISIIPIVIFVLYLLEYIKNKIFNNKETLPKISKTKENIILLSISLLFTIIVYFFFAPGLISPDTYVQWLEAIGHQELGDGGSALLGIIYRPFAMLFTKPEVYLSFQAFIFTFIIGKIILYFKNKINHKILIIFWILFILFPANFVYSFTLWKDIPYTLILIINTYFLIRYFRKDMNNTLWILFGFTNSLMYFFRHNGKIVALCLIVYFIILLILKRKKEYLYFLIISILSIVFVSKILFPLFKVDTRINHGDSPITTMVAHVYSKVLKDGHKVDQRIEKIMSKYADKNHYIELYDKYNIDWLSFNEDRINKYIKNRFTVKETLDVYFYLLGKYPKYVIEERFFGTDLLWNMSMSKESFNYVFVEGAELLISSQSEYEIYKKIDSRVTNKFTFLIPRYNIGDKYFGLLNILKKKYSVLDNIFFRIGLYINLFLISCLFIYKNNKKYFIVTSILMINTFTWLILMLHQSYRYLWYIPVLLFFIIISSTAYIKETKVNE